jgi:hypothetical protein
MRPFLNGERVRYDDVVYRHAGRFLAYNIFKVAVIESKYSLNWVRGVLLRCSCLEWVLSWCCPTCSRTPTDCMYLYDDGSVAVVISISVLFIVRVVFLAKC